MNLDLFDKPVEAPQKKTLFYHFHTFSQGTFILSGTSDGLCALGYPTTKPDVFFKNLKFRFPNNQLVKSGEPFEEAIGQIEEYFNGQRREFDLPLELMGTSYQLAIWKYLLTIPYGETQTYGQVASINGTNPRTAGRAIGDNPIPIVVPCHRVIGSHGQLVGYGGGINMKVWLLQHENAIML